MIDLLEVLRLSRAENPDHPKRVKAKLESLRFGRGVSALVSMFLT